MEPSAIILVVLAAFFAIDSVRSTRLEELQTELKDVEKQKTEQEDELEVLKRDQNIAHIAMQAAGNADEVKKPAVAQYLRVSREIREKREELEETDKAIRKLTDKITELDESDEGSSDGS